MNLIRHADPLVEADEIRAAAEEQVLAVVDDLVHAWMQIRARASAQVATTLDELHAEAGLSQRAGRTHAGHTAANDGHPLRRIRLHIAQQVILTRILISARGVPVQCAPGRSAGCQASATSAHWRDA